jgi:hypothetical protein
MFSKADDQRLNDFWDAIQRGDPASAADLPPGDVAIVWQLAEMRTSAPDRAFARDLEATLFGEAPLSPPSLEARMIELAGPMPAIPDRRDRRTNRSGRMQLLALAAAIVALVGAGAVIAGWRALDSEQERVIPAARIADDAPGLGRATVETLFSAAIDPEQLGQPDATNWDEAYTSFMEVQPGEAYTTNMSAFTCCPGLAVYEVLSGDVTIETDGPVRIYRSGENPDTPERGGSGSLVVLHAGDSAAHGNNVPVRVRNDGDTIDSFLVGYVYYTAVPQPQWSGPSAITYIDAELAWASTFSPSVLDPGPVQFAFDRIRIQPGEDIRIDTSENQVLFAVVIDGKLRFYFEREDGSYYNDPAKSIYGPRGTALNTLNGVTIKLANEFDQPTDLYLFRFDPPDGG